jgi:hypothetical protein
MTPHAMPQQLQHKAGSRIGGHFVLLVVVQSKKRPQRSVW